MIIKNFDKLAHSDLRKQLLTIAEAGFEAINTTQAVNNSLKVEKNFLIVQKQKFELKNFKRIFVFCFGKAALESAKALKEVLGERVYRGVVIDVAETRNITEKETEHQGKNQWTYFQATHPNISEQNAESSKEALFLLNNLAKDDLVICSISGGGSAIFEVPFEDSVDKEVLVFKTLTKAGATISELNTVRKHMSRVKGGQLAKHFFPATVINLVFSDVPGDDLSVIASGPLVKDQTTLHDAKNLLSRFEVHKQAGLDKIELIETPKEEKYFKNIHNFLAVSAKVALSAMREKAELLGWEVKIFNDQYQGEARLLANDIIASGKKHQCLLGAGESTVKILGHGKGGRNQEMALAALPLLSENQVFGCFASDGHDFTDCAGAIVDASTLKRARNLKLDYQRYLNNNDSFTFFDAVGDHVITGLTGSNVADFFIFLHN